MKGAFTYPRMAQSLVAASSLLAGSLSTLLAGEKQVTKIDVDVICSEGVGAADYQVEIRDKVDMNKVGTHGWRVFASPSTANADKISAITEVRNDGIYNSVEMNNSPIAFEWQNGASASAGWDSEMAEQTDYRKVAAGFNDGSKERPMVFSVYPESVDPRRLRIYFITTISGGTFMPTEEARITIEVRDGSDESIETTTANVPMPDGVNYNLFGCITVSFQLADSASSLKVSLETAPGENAFKELAAAALSENR